MAVESGAESRLRSRGEDMLLYATKVADDPAVFRAAALDLELLSIALQDRLLRRLTRREPTMREQNIIERAAAKAIGRIRGCRTYTLSLRHDWKLLHSAIRTINRRDRARPSSPVASDTPDTIPIGPESVEPLSDVFALLVLSSRCWTYLMLAEFCRPRAGWKGKLASLYVGGRYALSFLSRQAHRLASCEEQLFAGLSSYLNVEETLTAQFLGIFFERAGRESGTTTSGGIRPIRAALEASACCLDSMRSGRQDASILWAALADARQRLLPLQDLLPKAAAEFVQVRCGHLQVTQAHQLRELLEQLPPSHPREIATPGAMLSAIAALPRRSASRTSYGSKRNPIRSLSVRSTVLQMLYADVSPHALPSMIHLALRAGVGLDGARDRVRSSLVSAPWSRIADRVQDVLRDMRITIAGAASTSDLPTAALVSISAPFLRDPQLNDEIFRLIDDWLKLASDPHCTPPDLPELGHRALAAALLCVAMEDLGEMLADSGAYVAELRRLVKDRERSKRDVAND